MNRTEINELGEFGIIDKIKSNFKKKKSSTVISIGDDAAAIRSGKDLVLLSSDMLIEKIHFHIIPAWTHLGPRAWGPGPPHRRRSRQGGRIALSLQLRGARLAETRRSCAW